MAPQRKGVRGQEGRRRQEGEGGTGWSDRGAHGLGRSRDCTPGQLGVPQEGAHPLLTWPSAGSPGVLPVTHFLGQVRSWGTNSVCVGPRVECHLGVPPVAGGEWTVWMVAWDWCVSPSIQDGEEWGVGRPLGALGSTPRSASEGKEREMGPKVQGQKPWPGLWGAGAGGQAGCFRPRCEEPSRDGGAESGPEEASGAVFLWLS